MSERECVHCLEPLVEGQEMWVLGRWMICRGEKSGQVYDDYLGDANKPEAFHARCAPGYVDPSENDSVWDSLFEEMRIQVRDQEYLAMKEQIEEELKAAGWRPPEPVIPQGFWPTDR